ncbi:hypothetical protein Btru_030278 [Bulinus truncatus]|nr:hypothetical protein Btru_030278 [Bulinus truncatus]
MGLHSDNVDDVATSSNFKENNVKNVILDVHRTLKVIQVKCDEANAQFTVKKFTDYGKSLVIELPKTHQKDDNFSLEIEYEAGGGPALCWLEPQQTAIKSSLTCILRQSVPIQSYLIALAVGHIKSAAIGPRSEVWAEPSVLDSAQKEFQGMENPCLTFVTPCIIVGDKSLTDVVIHEITHSWFGNLVTNANWSEFWLNEGFTMFGQRRISETLHGRQAMCLEATTGQSLLHRHIEHKGHDHPLTRLRVIIEKGVDPDETYNETPYEKGFEFIKTWLEGTGRPPFEPDLSASAELTQIVDREIDRVTKPNAQSVGPHIKSCISLMV